MYTNIPINVIFGQIGILVYKIHTYNIFSPVFQHIIYIQYKVERGGYESRNLLSYARFHNKNGFCISIKIYLYININYFKYNMSVRSNDALAGKAH